MKEEDIKMKLKKITAAVLAAALVATSMSIAGFAKVGVPKLTLLNDAADSLKQRSNLVIMAASESDDEPVIPSPSDPGKETPNDPEKKPKLEWAAGTNPEVTVEVGKTSDEYKFILTDYTGEVTAASTDDEIATVKLNAAQDAVTVTGVAVGDTDFTVTAGDLTIGGKVTVKPKFEWPGGKKEKVIEIQLKDPSYEKESTKVERFWSPYDDQLNVKVDDPSVVKVGEISKEPSRDYYWRIELQGLKVGSTRLEISSKEAPEEKITATVTVIENIVVEPSDGLQSMPYDENYMPEIPEGLDEEDARDLVSNTLGYLEDAMTSDFREDYTESCKAVIDSLDKDSLPELRKEMEVSENSDVYVALKYEFKDMVLEAKDGKPHIKSMTFDITPYVAPTREFMDNSSETARLRDDVKKLDSKYLRKSMQIMIPVPIKEFVPEKNAYVSHNGDVRRNCVISENEVGARLVKYKTSHFSTFTLEFNNDPISNGGGSGSSGGSASSSGSSGSHYTASTEPDGAWVAGEKGWWYRYKDGTYPSNGWRLLEWQGKSEWYYFNEEGYMVSGWFTDVDGHRYFLHNLLDGTQGYMYTGWHLIDGKWYYFSTVSGGPLGSLLVNTTTPDGYAVGADGVWIQ